MSARRAVPSSARAIAAAGAVSLAVAMGIGRFAFTPILPLMLHDGVVDIAGASWLASANYLGYLAGALACTFAPWLARRLPLRPAPIAATRWVRGGLAATALLTLAMAAPWPAAWPALRFAAGVASAVTLVHTSSWCLGQLAARGAPALGGVIFAGPGAGIAVSGFVAGGVVLGGGASPAAWWAFGLLAVLLVALVWPVFGPAHAQARPPSIAPAPAAPLEAQPPQAALVHANARFELTTLTLAYGLAGFGYIVTATFLPVIARTALPGSAWTGLFWPMLGLGSVLGALAVTRLRHGRDQRARLAAAYAVQALGIALGIVWPTLAGFALGSFLVGLPFTAITFFALQEARQLRPAAAASAIGLLTALYGIGQAAGPPMVAALVAGQADASTGFTKALWVAAGVLAAGATSFLVMRPCWPRPHTSAAGTT